MKSDQAGDEDLIINLFQPNKTKKVVVTQALEGNMIRLHKRTHAEVEGKYIVRVSCLLRRGRMAVLFYFNGSVSLSLCCRSCNSTQYLEKDMGAMDTLNGKLNKPV